MSVRFERMAVIGLGLLGGSVALAARRRGCVGHTVGIGRRRAPLERALAAGTIDEIHSDPSAIAGADLVVLATPVGSMPDVLAAAGPHLTRGAIVTDVGSVKGVLADRLPALLPPETHYVGSHPMAGSHLRGVDHARADLFEGAACAVTPLPRTDSTAVDAIVDFWQALGARVVVRDPEQHDREVAWTSHVPHVMAFAFARALERAPDDAGDLAGSGFRDFTRIALSDAELWGDILAANRKAIAGPLHDCGEALSELARAIESSDTDAIERLLGAARQFLTALVNAPSGGENPEPAASPDGTADRGDPRSPGGH